MQNAFELQRLARSIYATSFEISGWPAPNGVCKTVPWYPPNKADGPLFFTFYLCCFTGCIWPSLTNSYQLSWFSGLNNFLEKYSLAVPPLLRFQPFCFSQRSLCLLLTLWLASSAAEVIPTAEELEGADPPAWKQNMKSIYGIYVRST